MVQKVIKKKIHKLINSFGYELRKKDSRNSFAGAIRQAKKGGLVPATVIDIGAAAGSFSSLCYEVFPDAGYVLIEPLAEFEPFLKKVTNNIKKSAYILTAVSKAEGYIEINVHSDLVGSSLYREVEDTDVNGVGRRVPVKTVDGLAKEMNLEAPFLLKLDVQGAELDVLEGARQVLQNTEYLLLEVSFFGFYKGGPQLHDVISFMKSIDFVAYDILGINYRPLDGAVAQTDIAFVKEAGMFRKNHYYANSNQRMEQDKKFELLLKEPGQNR